MWVASYGVMPQAYSVAAGPAAARTSSPVAVSCSRGAWPLPGSTGTSARRHDSMLARLSRAPGQLMPRMPGPVAPAEAGPANTGLADAGGEARGLAGRDALLEGVGQGDQARLGPAGAEEGHADRQAGHVPGRDRDRRAAGHRG